jgi:F-type H+-transporting ATPase subunit a
LDNASHSLFDITLFGHVFGVSINLVIQWIIILIIALVAIISTRNLNKVPGKRQTVLEMFVTSINGVIKEIMGKEYLAFAPYVGALGLFLLFMNLTGLIGFEPPTVDYSVSLGMALTTFIIIQAYAIKKNGLLHYFTAYGKPFAFLAPINILERFLLPLSLSLRLFGNMMAGAAVMSLIYGSLSSIGWVAQLGIPIPVHAYFDIFDGGIQMVVFTMLTMVNIKIISEH